MVKLKAPLMSLNAQGRLSKLFSLVRRQGQNIIERRPRPTDAQSPAQLFNRHMFTKCVDLWHLLSSAEQQEWESLARPRHMTGYAWYISQCLRPNPGIYLPLQGGKMSGDIDMDGNRIEDLPTPVANKDPVINTLTNGKMWQGNGANRPAEVDPPAGEAATKEFFAPVTFATLMRILGGYSYVPGGEIDSSGDEAGIAFFVPADFSSITEAVVVRMAAGNGTYRLNYYSSYSANGEACNTHVESLLDQDTVEIFTTLYEQDISGILSSLAAGDYVGIEVKGDSINVPDDIILGVRFKYS